MNEQTITPPNNLTAETAAHCSCCNAVIPKLGDISISKLCDICKDNPERQKFFKDQKKLDEKIKQYEQQIATIEKDLGPVDWCYRTDEDHPFNVSELVGQILNQLSVNSCSIVTDQTSQTIYFYNEKSGIYHKNGELYLEVMIDKVLLGNSTPHRIHEAIDLLKTRTYATITQSKKIAVENGVFDVETETLEPFSRYEFVTNKLKLTYKPEAKSEPWLKFINQVCPDDKALLQEWSGYLLIKGYPFHAIMWLYGPTGRNGKGTWVRTMEAILGDENYSNVSIDEFDGKHRFAVYNLHDSLFNACSEPRTDKILTIEMLQMLTGQDSVDAEKKAVQQRFKFKNGAKMTIMGNKFPNVDKPTDAFWDRLKLCKFPNRYVNENQIQDIENKWLNDPEQRSGIFNWMLEGKNRLLKNHGFTLTKTQEETIIQFKRASDSIGAFIAECLQFGTAGTDYFSTKIDAQEHYKNYCLTIGVAPETDKKFSERLKNTPRIRDTSKRIQGKKTKVWGGIKLLPLPTEEESEESQKTLDVNQSGTNGTAGTDYDPLTLGKNTEKVESYTDTTASKSVPPVPAVPILEDSESKGYEQLVCYFCQKPIMDLNWIRDDFTEGKPAHRKCYDEKQAERKDYSDEDPREGQD